MTERYTSESYNCGCTALRNDDGEFINGSYATWPEHVLDEDGWKVATAYGAVCSRCLDKWWATECKLGGEPLDAV